MVGPVPKFDIPKILAKIFLHLPVFVFKWALKYVQWHVIKFRVDIKSEPEQAEKYREVIGNADPWKVRQSGREAVKFDIWNDLNFRLM